MSAQPSRRLRPPRLLISALGADYNLLLASGSQVAAKRFTQASVVLLAIWILSFLSVNYAMGLLFHMWYVEWGLALIIATLLMLLYVFLINTFSKESFNTIKAFTFSNISRVGFILFMAFMISKPIEVFVCQPQLKAEVISYRNSLLESFSKRMDILYRPDMMKLEQRKKLLTEQQKIYETAATNAELLSIDNQISTLAAKKDTTLQTARFRIDESPFFLHQVKCAGSNGLAWIVCMGVILLFMIPGYLIYTLPPEDAYLRLKASSTRKGITDAFKDFEQRYLRIFADQKLPVTKYSTIYKDPPFNKERQAVGPFSTQDDFLKRWGPFS